MLAAARRAASAVREAASRRAPPNLSGAPARATCSCTPSAPSPAPSLTGTESPAPPFPAHVGTVPHYDAHLLVQLAPRDESASAPPFAPPWPKFVESEPALLAVLAALAARRSRRVKKGGGRPPDAAAESAGGAPTPSPLSLLDPPPPAKIKLTAYDFPASRSRPGSALRILPPVPSAGHANLVSLPDGRVYANVNISQVKGVVDAEAEAAEGGEENWQDPTAQPEGEPSPSRGRVRPTYELDPTQLLLMVCCHGARDARCGTEGPRLAVALEAAAAALPPEIGDQVAVVAVSHVGGHRWAGNVLVQCPAHPCDGDWFGGVEAAGASDFLAALTEVELGADGGAEDARLRPLWRGRAGLTKAEQLELWERGGMVDEFGEGSDDDEDWQWEGRPADELRRGEDPWEEPWGEEDGGRGARSGEEVDREGWEEDQGDSGAQTGEEDDGRARTGS